MLRKRYSLTSRLTGSLGMALICNLHPTVYYCRLVSCFSQNVLPPPYSLKRGQEQEHTYSSFYSPLSAMRIPFMYSQFGFLANKWNKGILKASISSAYCCRRRCNLFLYSWVCFLAYRIHIIFSHGICIFLVSVYLQKPGIKSHFHNFI